MESTVARFSWIGVSLSGLIFLGWVLTGQATKSTRQGLPTDWSHSHVVFTQPASATREALIGQDPRYCRLHLLPVPLPDPESPS